MEAVIVRGSEEQPAEAGPHRDEERGAAAGARGEHGECGARPRHRHRHHPARVRGCHSLRLLRTAIICAESL